ncbi:hypothetical protein QQ045_011386 [Rhodiola kirilowii]
MSLIAWNCRGLGSSSAIRAVKDVVSASRPRIVGLIETKATKKRCEEVRLKLGFRCCFCVPARDRSGGLALLWKDESEVTICNFSCFHIDFIVTSPIKFRATLFYGDFNEILSYSDMSRNALRRSNLMRDFRKVLVDSHLSELPFKGSKFTYTNRRKGQDETKCRLDRVLVSDDWRKLYINAYVVHMTSFHSDHNPIKLCLNDASTGRSSPFRFESMWNRDTRFRDLVSDHWQNGGSSGNLLHKLESLKGPIKTWNRKVFVNVNEKVNNLRRKLSEIRDLPRTEVNINIESDLMQEMDEWLKREEVMWCQRSRVTWLREGDNNTSFFHRKATARKRANNILHLRNNDGNLCYDQLSLETIAKQYFMNIFQSEISISDEEIMESFISLPRKVTSNHNSILLAPYSEREVYAALMQMNPAKAPGLDGYHAAFFQQYWQIVKNDFLALCLSILNDGVIPPGLNDTLLVLITKQKKVIEKMEDLRPISLITVVSRVVAKAIVNRLQLILPEVISTEQSAFVNGRLISDNFILAHECAHVIKKTTRGKKIFGSLKLDMSKAYDRMEWRFLKLIMIHLGFAELWVDRIFSYISSVTYCVRLNGSISVFQSAKRFTAG